MTDTYPITPRTEMRIKPDRASYDRALIESILDEAFVCHVAVSLEGTPHVVPTLYARSGDRILLHGNHSGSVLAALRDGAEVCVAVTLVDALVLARSAFHHSVNYRSVVLYGRACVIPNGPGKLAALESIVEHVVPGRWEQVRWPTEAEMKQTAVLAIDLTEASAKVRSGGPVDDEADLDLPVWAGVLPLDLVPAAPVPAPDLPAGVEVPDHVAAYRRPASAPTR